MAAPICCPRGSHGAAPADTGHTPVGVWETAADLEVYVVGQKVGPTSALLVVSDVFGPKTGLHVRICDEIAQAVPGSVVFMPDLFHGHPIAAIWPGPITMHLFGLIPFVHRMRYRCGWANVWPQLEALLDTMREQVGPSVPIACLGFCWGAWVVFRGCASGRFVAGVGFHPSLKVSKLQCHPHNVSDDSIARSMKCPILILPAGNDEETLKPGGAFVKAVQEVQPASRSKEYTEMLHGWVNRGTAPDCVVQQKCSTDVVANAQASAIQDAVMFLSEVLGAASSQSQQ